MPSRKAGTVLSPQEQENPVKEEEVTGSGISISADTLDGSLRLLTGDLSRSRDHEEPPCPLFRDRKDDPGPGYQLKRPNALSRLDQGEPPRAGEDGILGGAHSEIGKVDDHESMDNSLEQWHRFSTFNNTVHQSGTHFLLRKNPDMLDLHRKNMKSDLTSLNQSRSFEIKNPAELTGDGKSFLCYNMTLQVPSVAPQTSLNMSGLLTNRNVVIVGQPVARCAPSGGFGQDRHLMNAVNVVVPSVVNYVLFYVTENQTEKLKTNFVLILNVNE
ncbi:hypothetical protein MC885_007517 [Smutsia gigantea]|nr:hypothetical protein MC885_007517 [Smutsia gigantea]